ncbi:MAG TPA: 4Fe-4S dicluster domain-containing protein [Thermodesulfobacteriota bacterium]|nr:4Fe-4S dicluster domain-containing protein [Thermodesulfobacteriota bacterium]
MKKLSADPIKCTGCRSCMLVCSLMHTDAHSYDGARIRIQSDEPRGVHTPVLCKFCEDPDCVSACTVQALSKDQKTGSIRVDDSLCNGCEACVDSCPHSAMFFDAEKGVPFTCDLCQGDPECVKVCRLPEALNYL